jgi:hypothetical protein
MKRLLSLGALFLFLFLSQLYGQGLLGTIVGTVTDSTGGVIVGATVTAKNPATNFAITAATRGNGLYQLPNLPVGTYTVSISQREFQTVVHTQILVQGDPHCNGECNARIGNGLRGSGCGGNAA